MRFRSSGLTTALPLFASFAFFASTVACDKMPWNKKAADAGDDAAAAVTATASATAPAADTAAPVPPPLDTTAPVPVPVPNVPGVKKDAGATVTDAGVKVDASVAPVPTPVPTPSGAKPPALPPMPSNLKLPPGLPTALPTAWPPK